MSEMQGYRPGQGFGVSGLTVTPDGYTFRFARPVGRVIIKNAVQNGTDIYYGINQVIAGSDGNGPESQQGQEKEARTVGTITVVEALATGNLLRQGDSEYIQGPGDGGAYRREIFCLWFITVEGNGVVKGGVVGF